MMSLADWTMHLADYWPSTCKGCVDGPQKGVIRGVKWWWLLVRTVGDGRHLCTCVHFRFWVWLHPPGHQRAMWCGTFVGWSWIKECSIEVTCDFHWNNCGGLGLAQSTIGGLSACSGGMVFITCMLLFSTAGALFVPRVLSLSAPACYILLSFGFWLVLGTMWFPSLCVGVELQDYQVVPLH